MGNENETNIEALENNMVYAMSKFVQGTVSGVEVELGVMEKNIGNLDDIVTDLKIESQSVQDDLTTLREQELKLSVINSDIKSNLTEVRLQSDLNMELLSEVDNRSQDNAKVLKSLDTAGHLMLEDGSDMKQAVSEMMMEVQSIKDAMVMLREAFENLANFGL